MQQNIFCFTGLGADERLFSKVFIPGFTLKHIQYVKPLDTETLPDYAKRLCSQINEVNPILLGVSFGGMLAVEAAKYLQAKKVIIISSTKSADLFPTYYHLANKFQLLKLFPSRIFNTSGIITNYFFGAETTDDRNVLRHFIKSADSKFIKWALQKIIIWNNSSYPVNLIQIHGTKDRIIPISDKVDFSIKNGGHLMIYNRANEINDLLQICLSVNR